MKKLLLSVLLFTGLATLTIAQDRTLSYVMTLKMPEGPGARCASIAWHPTLKRYYAPKSGNAQHLMGIFDAKGNLVSPDGLKTMFDIRGFWYNPKMKTFCANGYNDNGWMSYELDNRGVPTDYKMISSGMKQPNEQSVGSYDEKNNQVYFLDGQFVVAYDAATQTEKSRRQLYINQKDKDDTWGDDYDTYDETITPENINGSTVLYTGIPKKEFALLDFKNKEIQLYSKATGYITQKLILPSDAPADEILCFSYCNNMFWLFDIDSKVWKAYK